MTTRSRAVSSGLAMILAGVCLAQDRPETPPWSEDAQKQRDPKIAPQPKVPLRWDRWYHVPELEKAMGELAAGFPDLITLSVIGKSVEGRDLTMMTVTDRATGDASAKPAMWVDGNIHGNEVQGSETCLYLVWWLTVWLVAKVDRIIQLLEQIARALRAGL